MKKILLLSSLFASAIGFTQVTLFEDSFDTYNDFVISGFGQWQTLDLDLLNTYTGGTVGPPTWSNAGSPQAFQVFNPTTALVANGSGDCSTEATENLNFNPRTGAKYAACWAAVPSQTGGPTANDDWLISPPISLVNATGTQLSVWYKALSDCFGSERFTIGVYVGSGTPTQSSDFTIISSPPYITAGNYTTWTERIQALNAYNGQTIRIGFHCISPDRYMLMIDDFKVTATSVMATDDFIASKFNVYPNPVNNLVNISNNGDGGIQINKVAIADINGRTVKSINLDGVLESQINISELNAGLYFVYIDTSEGFATKKMVKK